MPPFSLSHKLLSARHPDTQAPGAGADPSDGQVATWSDALGAWIAADPAAGGVTDHGLLDGLADDDHEQYALADKSRPAAWVAAGDLAGRSIADLGTKAHDLLDGLDDDDHPQYAAIAQNENITGLWRIPNTTSLRFGHAAGPTLAGPASGDQLTLTGDQQISGVLALKGCAVDASKWANLSPVSPSGNAMRGVVINPSSPVLTGNNASFYGLQGAPIATVSSGITGVKLHGLDFMAGVAGGAGGAAVSELEGVWVRMAVMIWAGTIAKMVGFEYAQPFFSSITGEITEHIGLELPDMGSHAQIVDAYGIRIANMTLNSGVRRLIEAGPATPFFRVEGGTAPAGENSTVIINFGGTLYRLTRDAATGVVETAAA